MKAIVKLSINETNMLQNLRYVFSGKVSFLRELLQNSRRAGATEVGITTTEEHGELTLTYADNGCGIADLQKLFTVAESGWDEALVKQESAFGMGFTSALFVAEEITVTSLGKEVRFLTQDVIESRPVNVNEVLHTPGMGLVMRRVDKKIIALEIERFLDNEVSALPMDVYLNGKKLKRTAFEAMHNEAFIQRDIPGIGHVTIDPACFTTSDIRGDAAYSLRIRHYLLGHPIGSTGGSYHQLSTHAWVELDPTKFHARMPDRDSLIDSNDMGQMVENAVYGLIYETIKERLSELDHETFLNRHYKAILVGDRYSKLPFKALLNEIPVLPTAMLARYQNSPQIAPFYGADLADHGIRKIGVTRSEIESGEVVITTNYPTCVDDVGHLYGLVAYRKGWINLEESLDSNHWAVPYLRNLTDLDVEAKLEETLKVDGVIGEGEEYGDVNVEIKFCERYSVEYEGETLVFDDVPIVSKVTQPHCDAELLVPRNASASDVIACYASPSDEDGGREQFEELTRELARSLRSQFGGTFANEVSMILCENWIASRDRSAALVLNNRDSALHVSQDALREMLVRCADLFDEGTREKISNYLNPVA